MKNIILILGVMLICGHYLPVSAEPSPMVQRHIFAPDPGSEQNANVAAPTPIDSAGLEKDLIFTGVLLTAKGKQVILSEAGKKEKGIQKQKHIMKEGESIKGMTIKEIGSNYLLLSSNENLVRIKLYGGIKTRPAPPPEPPPIAAGAATNPAAAGIPPVPGNQPQTAAPGSPPDPKMDMKLKNAARRSSPPEANSTGGENTSPEQATTNTMPQANVNPFADILKRSAENAPPGGAGIVNPFTGK